MKTNDTHEELTMTDAEWTAAIQAMTDAGKRDGASCGEWVASGNTPETELREMLRLWGEGDPLAPHASAPFSGEWADQTSATEMIDFETECDVDSLSPEEIDELATAYEDAYYPAWEEAAERTVRGLLGE